MYPGPNDRVGTFQRIPASGRKSSRALEARTGFEPACDGFADRCLTAWLPGQSARLPFHGGFLLRQGLYVKRGVSPAPAATRPHPPQAQHQRAG